ncbi:hypothetical protein L208DRAFT_226283 [Tricholoma matsutake]|nr:hypothetical protein L208DRAFT_226283 [Tricholoma matsutake 945]
MSSHKNSLRQRTNLPNDSSQQGESSKPQKPPRDEVVWGKTPSGEVFCVPTTHDVLTTLFHPDYPKSHLDLFNLALLAFQIMLFLFLPRGASQIFFFAYFAFWRGMYNLGLGWVLTRQSKKRWIVREVQKLGWLDGDRRPKVRKWIREQLVGKMGKDYEFDELPLEYNAWLLFRQAVDVILVNDFLSYCMFAFSCFRVPQNLSTAVHIMRWVGGIALIAFNLWVKTEAHNVVKDYGWYWGDVFFQRGALVFDGVFELAPHPMYSVGYAGYYGLSLIAGSYAVLFVSLAAHAAQFAFLVFFENPHIQRMYGKRKAIAKRTPLFPSSSTSRTVTSNSTATSITTPAATVCPAFPDQEEQEQDHELADMLSTPAATEDETATETETELETTETEMDEHIQPQTQPQPQVLMMDQSMLPGRHSIQKKVQILPTPKPNVKARHQPQASITSLASVSSSADIGNGTRRKRGMSQHDLLNKYFRRDAVVLRNVDLLRANDAMLVLVLFYAILLSVLPSVSPSLSHSSVLRLHFLHALTWCFVHYVGLGWVLSAQSQTKFLVRHFVKNYHYRDDTEGLAGARVEAFANWKAIYNLSMCMTYVSCIGVVWETYSIPNDWIVGNELLRHTLGLLLIGLHVWASMESYEVLGVFGWFFGDFFMEDFPAHLEYTGIYRYLNNPEAMGGAAWFGLALISGSKLVLSLAVVRHIANWWFLSWVENPHMKKLYGDSLRKDAGFVKVIKHVASKNARLLGRGAQRHAPELGRVVKEVKGTFEKVYEETAEVVEEFLAKSRPKISEVVEDTKFLLQQSRERLVITRVSNDLSAYDKSKYKVSIVPSTSTGGKAFQLGEPITVKWEVPHKHSRKDWIGLYRVGANKSTLVTKTSSQGMWVPVHNEDWEGDVWTGSDRMRRPPSPRDGKKSGVVTFKGNTLPWLVGQYEVRYHHDGKYNVMALDGPLEISVDKPAELNFASVRESLMKIVPLCLDSDPSLLPRSCNLITPRIGDTVVGPIRPSSSVGSLINSARPSLLGSAPSLYNNLSGSRSKALPNTDLDFDPQSVPYANTNTTMNNTTNSDTETPHTDTLSLHAEDSDPDDFTFWEEQQAKRICLAIEQVFGVEYAPEVVVADANLTALANRILLSKEILTG